MIKTLATIIALITISTLPTVAHATDEDYKLCAISGFFSASTASNGAFLFGLAERKKMSANSTNVSAPECTALYKEGREVANRWRKHNGTVKSAADKKIVSDANEFKLRIEDAILKAAGF